MEQLLLILLGAAISATGYLIANAMEKKSERSAVDTYAALFELTTKLEASGKSLEDLDAFNALVQKANIFRPAPLRRKQGNQNTNEGVVDAPIETTYDMVIRMNDEIDQTKLRITQALHELNGGREALDAPLAVTQNKFEEYVQACAQLENVRWEGGTIRPVMVNARVLSLMEARAKELEEEVRYMRTL